MATSTGRASQRSATASQVEALTEQVAQLTAKVEAIEQALAGTHPPPARDADPAGADSGRYFPSLEDFVNLWLLPTFRRPTEAVGMGSWRWCARWWDHPEARLVFGALWDEWEANRVHYLGMIEFTHDVLQMLPEVCGEHGPFARCRGAATEDGYQMQRHQHVPIASTAPAPPGWWDNWWVANGDHAKDQSATLQFADVEEFVTTLFLPTFRRDLSAVGVTRWHWCDQWWNHDETVHHFLNLWYLYEARAPQGRLVEFVRETYYLLPHLLGGADSMRECVPRREARSAKHVDLPAAPTS